MLKFQDVKTHKTMSYKFKCPNCEHKVIEEIMSDVYQLSEIIDIDEYGDILYGEIETSDGSVERYQCKNCGTVLTDSKGKNITDKHSLAKYLGK